MHEPGVAYNFIKKWTLAQVFSSAYCEICNNSFFTEHLRPTASGRFQMFSKLMFLGSKDSNTGVFLWILQNFYEQLFYRTPQLAASALNFIIYLLFSVCKLRPYNLNPWIAVYLNRYRIRWNRTRPIFSKFDQTNLIKQKCVKFCCIHYQIHLIQ